MPQRDLTHLLLPGCDGRSATWSRVAALLRERGDLVETPDGWDQAGLRSQAQAVAWARRAGLEVRWIDSGHQAMRDDPDALAHLLGELRTVDA